MLTALLSMIFSVAHSQEASAELVTEWKKPLNDPGQSNICIKNGLLFFTSHNIEETDKMKGGFFNTVDVKGICYDIEGNFKWEVLLKGETADRMRVLSESLDHTSMIPVATDKHVWFLNPLGELTCCTHDGTKVWSKNFSASRSAANTPVILYKDLLIVSLPTGEVENDYKHYRLHALNPGSGEIIWRSDKLLNHGTGYKMVSFKEQPTLLTSTSGNGHYGIEGDSYFQFIHMDTGETTLSMKTGPFVSNKFYNLYNGHVMGVGRDRTFQYTNLNDGSIFSHPVNKCDEFFQWDGSAYQLVGEKSFREDNVNTDRAFPINGYIHFDKGRAIYWGNTKFNALTILDMKTKKQKWIEVPYQIINNRKIWNFEDIVFTEGVYGINKKPLLTKKGSHSYQGLGWNRFGDPVLIKNKLFWITGSGVIHIIDIEKELSPQSVQTLTIDPVGEAWTTGGMAYHDGYFYIRTQKDLHKISINLP